MDRLARTRLPQPAPVDDWDYGTPNDYLRDAVEQLAHDVRLARGRGPHQRRSRTSLTEIDGQPIHFIHVRSAHPGATPLLLAHTYPGSSVDYLDMIGPLVDPVAHGGRAEDAFGRRAGCPGLRLPQPGHRGRLDHRPRRRALRQADAPARITEYGIHGSDNGALVARELGLLEPRGLPRPARAAAVLVPVGRPGRVRAARAAGLRGTRAHAVVPVGRRLQHDERLAPADRRRRPQRLAGRAARLQRAVQLLRQRHVPRAAREDPHRGERRTGSRTPRRRPSRCYSRTPAPRPSRRSTPPAPGSPCSRTTSRRSRSSPSATTRTSCTGAGSRRAGTTRRSRSRMVVGDIRAFFGTLRVR